MAYLEYNGQMVIFNDQYVISSPLPGIDGVIDFDGINDWVDFTTAYVPSFDINSGISFKFYLDNDSGYTGERLYNLNIDSLSYISGILLDSSLYLMGFKNAGFVSQRRMIDISGLNAQVLDCSINIENSAVTEIIINGVSQTIYTTTGGDTSHAGNNSIGSNGANDYLSNATIWDFKIYDNTNTLIHAYAGQPSGNTDGAWADSVGSYDGTVEGSPTTRNLPV